MLLESRSAWPEPGRRTSGAASFPAKSLRRPLVFRVDRDVALKCRDAFDDFRHALQRQHHEAGRYYEFDRPAHQAAGIARYFADGISLVEERPRQIAEQQAGRDQEEQRADHVEPELAALGEEQIEDLDPNVLVALER